MIEATPAELAAELQRRARREAFLRAGPAGVAEHLSAGQWRRARHLDVLNECLIAVAEGRIRRLLITEPPRHGKSELASHWFPAWYLTAFPRHHVILASYEAEFASSWGRKVRNTLQQHAEQLPVRLADDSSSASRWHTTKGGGMETAGAGGALTGKGAHLLLVDDPVKNSEEADSQLIRDRTWNWWTSTAYTRLEPAGAVVLTMTRWHEDDLAGRLMAEMAAGGEQWTVLNLPALAEAGDALGRPEGAPLWPERFGLEALERIKAAVGPRVWTSLYQQRPSPESGAMFLREWFRYWRHPWQPEPTNPAHAAACVVLPKHFQEVFQVWDLALKNTEGSDLVAGGKIGCNGALRFLLDVDWRRMSFVESLAAMVKLASSAPAGPVTLVEDAANGPAAISALRTTLSGIVAVKPQGSKRARFSSGVTPVAAAGQFFLPYYHPQRQEMEEHLVSFPHGAHDDLADMLGHGLHHVKHRQYPELADDPAEQGSTSWKSEDIARMQRQIAEENEGW